MGTHSSPSAKWAQPPNFWPMYCGQTAEWIKMPLGRGVGLGPGHIVLHGDPATAAEKGTQQPPPNFWPMYCGQTAGFIKVPLGTEVDLGPGHIVLDGAQLPSGKGHSSPLFSPCLLWPNGRPRPSQLLLSSCSARQHSVKKGALRCLSL